MHYKMVIKTSERSRYFLSSIFGDSAVSVISFDIDLWTNITRAAKERKEQSRWDLSYVCYCYYYAKKEQPWYMMLWLIQCAPNSALKYERATISNHIRSAVLLWRELKNKQLFLIKQINIINNKIDFRYMFLSAFPSYSWNLLWHRSEIELRQCD